MIFFEDTPLASSPVYLLGHQLVGTVGWQTRLCFYVMGGKSNTPGDDQIFCS
jgi:hypothetical protein